jgi:hypothetical protein
MSIDDFSTAEEFGKRLEDYFGGKKYTRQQKHEIKRWAERRSPRTRYLVYRLVVEKERFLPLVATLNELLVEAEDGYPELDRARAPSGAKQITDDAGWTDEDMERALEQFRTIAGRAAEARRFG